MTWTPREDCALLRTRAKLRVLRTPALQQSQWQDVAFDVAAASGAAMRTADECLERYEALLSGARNTHKTQWSGDEKTHKLLEAALAREVRVTVATRKTARRGSKKDLETPASSPQKLDVLAATPVFLGVGGSVATDESNLPRSQSKRPLGYEAVTMFTVDHDKTILRAVKEIERGKSERWFWHKVGLRVTEETASYIAPGKCKSRYAELTQMSPEEIQARFGDSKGLHVDIAQTLYCGKRNARASCQVVSTPSTKADSVSEPQIAYMSRTTSDCQRQSAKPTTDAQGETAVVNPTSASSSSEASAPRSSTDDGESFRTAAQDQAEYVSPIGIDAQSQQLEDARQAEITDLKKALAMMAASITSLRTEVSHVRVENTELKNAVVDLRMQLDRNNRSAAVAAAEISLLRVEMEHGRDKGYRGAMEAPSTFITNEIAEVRSLLEQNVDSIRALAKRCEDNEKADSQQRAIIFEMIETEAWKREKSSEQQHAKYQGDRQKLEDDIHRLEDQVNLAVERQDEAASLEALSFEIVEAEVRKREELAATVQELAVHVEELRSNATSGSHPCEKSLLVFQDKIRQELHQLQDQERRTLSKCEGTQDSPSIPSRPVLSQGETMIRMVDETKRYLVAQHLQTTVQLQELRGALEKERQDRAQQFTALLQSTQRRL